MTAKENSRATEAQPNLAHREGKNKSNRNAWQSNKVFTRLKSVQQPFYLQ